MQRSHQFYRLAALAVVATLATACSSSGKGSGGAAARASSPSAAEASSAGASPAAGSSAAPTQGPTSGQADAKVTGTFGTTPTVLPGNGQPPATTQVVVVTRGTGPALKAGDLAVVDDYGRTWTNRQAFQNTFDATNPPDTLPVGTGQIGLPGLDKALVGVPAGSRVLVVLPPKDGFGNVTSLPPGVQKTDTALLVFDVRAGFAGNAGPTGTAVTSGGGGLPTISGALNVAPTITMPKTPAPTTLSVTTLIQGSGPAVGAGEEVVVQYVGDIWASGKVFDSSWKRSVPSGFAVGVGNLIKAWDTGLVGVKVGSRVLIIAPPGSGYGSAGQSDAGISGTDTLVFVVDVLGAYAK